MATHPSFRSMLALSGKWGGRLTAVLLFLFWGAFFVEHLSEWFFRSDGRYPPPWVWRQQFAHFAMLAGLAVMLKWDRLGSLVLAIATVGFFGGIGFHGFPFIALLNLIPVVLFSAYWIAEGHRHAPAH
jgi:hypothetical protein